MKRRDLAVFLIVGAALTITKGTASISAPLSPDPEDRRFPFPRLANVYYGPISRAHVLPLARYDLLICSGEHFASARFAAIRDANPNVKILPYIDSVTGSFADPGGPRDTVGFSNNWFLQTSNGSNIVFEHRMTNCSDLCPTNAKGQRWTDFLAQWVHDNYWAKGIGDGVFFDNSWNLVDWVSSNVDLGHTGGNDIQSRGGTWVNQHWEAGMQNLVRATRELFGSNGIVVCNGPLYGNTWENGQLNEGFIDWQTQLNSNSFSANLTRYFDWTTNHYGSEYYVMCQDPNQGLGLQSNYSEMRYWLGVTLLGDGYFTFSGPQPGSYSNIWWYDEYSVDLTSGRATGDANRKGYLGYPKTSATQLRNGVWRRDFDNGIVLVNTTGSTQGVSLETTYRRISGTQDPSVNNGALVSSVSLQNQNTIILLRRTAPPISLTAT